MKPPLQTLIDQTTIIHKETDFRKLQIAEAVSIISQRPSINIQQSADFILPSARPQERHAPPEQRHHQEGAVHQSPLPNHPANQRPGPVTRAALRSESTFTLSQGHDRNPSANDNSAHLR